MTTEQNQETPAATAAVMENMRAMAEAFRQERDLYAARLADLQERHDRLRRLCDTLSEGSELLIGVILASPIATAPPGHCGAADPCTKGWRRPRTAHCACCDALIIRRRYYAGTEGPFCRLCHGVRLEQRRKEAAGRNGQ